MICMRKLFLLFLWNVSKKDKAFDALIRNYTGSNCGYLSLLYLI